MNANTMFVQVRNALQTEIVISAKAKLEKLHICQEEECYIADVKIISLAVK